MVENGYEPQLSLYNSVIPGLCKEGKVQEVERSFDNALRSGHNPDEGMWTMLIDGLLKDKLLGKL